MHKVYSPCTQNSAHFECPFISVESGQYLVQLYDITVLQMCASKDTDHELSVQCNFIYLRKTKKKKRTFKKRLFRLKSTCFEFFVDALEQAHCPSALQLACRLLCPSSYLAFLCLPPIEAMVSRRRSAASGRCR